MSLMQELESSKKEIFSKISKETIETLLKTTDELVKSGIAENALKVGDKIPEFAVKDIHGKTVSSSEALKKGPLVVSFYRGGWCPYCSLELRALEKYHDEIKANKGTILALSPELPDRALKSTEDKGLSFVPLADANNEVARSFGLVFELVKGLANLYRLGFDLDLTEINGTDKFELPIPATYVTDSSGVVRHAFVDADYTKRMEPTAIIETLKALS